jgi:type IV pilus assembly protein PilB
MQSANTVGEIFVTTGLITQEQLQLAIDKQMQLKTPEKIGNLLVSMGLITERDQVKCLGEQWSVPYIDLTETTIEPGILRKVTQELARRFKVVPVDMKGSKLMLAMKNPLDIFAIDEIRLITGMEVEPLIATEEDIINAISNNYRQ